MPKRETILVLCAHNDDGLIGAGGTLTKYADQGKQVLTIIFSYGEFSNPQIQPDLVKERRIREAIDADKITGGSGITFFGLREGHFEEDAEYRNVPAKIKYILKKYNPSKVLTHSIDDPHPDHRACYRVVMDVMRKFPKTEVYTFDVWNLLNLRHRDRPMLITDTSKTYQRKMNAFKAHQSQMRTPGVFMLYYRTWVKDWWNGMFQGTRAAEVLMRMQ